ncbi:hypothetical protein SASPL_102251 [Salvia splendens]|uniref:Uncharacterized protein n=1 Tax=Salvia splendens TaxID=180675 RepID=A0A8X9ACN8_SALSN|nr:hypothetical protein SASPL_102251 [Salvia splendens]
MGQQQLIYSFVARGTTILAEYTEFNGILPPSLPSVCRGSPLPVTNSLTTAMAVASITTSKRDSVRSFPLNYFDFSFSHWGMTRSCLVRIITFFNLHIVEKLNGDCIADSMRIYLD